MNAWLNIIGVGEAGVSALPHHARNLIEAARTVIGPHRFVSTIATTDQDLIAWSSPLSAMIDQVINARGTPTVILATGDPNWFGIGATLARHLEAQEFALHPAASAFQLAAARLHWPLQNVTPISLHGRAVAHLHPHVLPGNRILALTSDATTLNAVATLLIERGYASSVLTVLENLGGSAEAVSAFTASDANDRAVGDFYVLAIDCVADAGADLLPAVPGLPDTAFVSDGQLTKREVRAATLAKLAPHPGALLWDVGAGCGSVAIEWMRAARAARAICFEQASERCAMIETNRHALGTPSLEIVQGTAPESFDGQPDPDAIFVGGDVGNDALFDECLARLKPGGRIVANAVTIEGEAALFARQAEFGGELSRIEVSVMDTIGAYRAFRPRMAVTQYALIKDQAR